MTTATISSTEQGFSLLRLWRNKESRSVIIQILTVAVLFAFFAFIISNAATNLERIGKDYKFAFLWEASNYDISQVMIEYTSQSSNFTAMIVGIINTLLVAVFGIITATILGFFMGVVRLSQNFVANRMVYCVIEFIRNVPVLLHIVLIYGIVVNVLPHPKEALNWSDTFFLSNRGLYFPAPEFGDAFVFVTIAFVLGIIGTFLFTRYAHKVQEETGKALPVFYTSIGLIIGLPVVIYFVTGMPLEWI